ncbi:MAG: glycosyltransferase involved in cell wall biosynthesis [Crocinitomix sp.]|jgi:glycosyltransferase involved in cell wall biosynthesis
MKISIITVAFNSAQTIEDTIQSVLSQDYPSVEYIIIDGGSTDGTMEIVNRYKAQITTIISESDKGIYDGMNKGIALATGEVVGILNSDDFYANENVLSHIAAQFKPETDAVYADLVYVDQVQTDKIIRKWISGEYVHGAFKKGWMPPHPTLFVKNEIYKKLGSYSQELRSAADYEFMLRVIHKHQIKLNYLPEIIVQMRAGGVSNASFKNRIKANKEDRLAWKMNDLKPGSLTFIRKPLSKIKQFIQK